MMKNPIGSLFKKPSQNVDSKFPEDISSQTLENAFSADMPILSTVFSELIAKNSKEKSTANMKQY